MEMKRAWWKESVVYQIYPRSFFDGNGDGIGDLQGIIGKLDYIKSLGVDVIWICPIYESPNDDNGYDISDYRSIMKEFGDMGDFKQLLEGIHQREMKLVMDLVVNHTSDEHPWFTESRSGIHNPKRDYYIWRHGENGKPPNNWQSFFGGDAWEYDEDSGEYYLHLFSKKQPDLNWENPDVRAEVYDIMRFWLEQGVDGFRMDVISLISKGEFADTPYEILNDTTQQVYASGPRIHEFLHEMNQEVIRHFDILTVGEGPGITLAEGLDYVKEDRNELGMIFHFDHMVIDHGNGGRFDPVLLDFIKFKKIFMEWDQIVKKGGWTSIFLGNHDFSRIVSRFGDDGEFWEKSAKALCMMLLSLRGTTYLYNGDEIGMTNVAYDSWEDYRDLVTLHAIHDAKNNGADTEVLKKAIDEQGRDNSRTPMQWTSGENGGFSEVEPWIKTNPNYHSINIQSQDDDPNSILNFYREMIKIRKTYKTLVYGEFEPIAIDHPEVFAYWRADQHDVFLSVINFSKKDVIFEADGRYDLSNAVIIMSNYNRTVLPEPGKFNLAPWEAMLISAN